jgi:L-arabinokinase
VNDSSVESGGLQAFVDTIRNLNHVFDRGEPVTVTRAPGRLDVMGGIADYSGSLVLQRTIAEATFAALQRTNQPSIEIRSLQDASRQARVFTISLESLAPGGEPLSYERARDLFPKHSTNHWAAYVAGVFLVLIRERGVRFTGGAKLVIGSSIPEGKGVASSAALEVASMQAVASTFGVALTPHEMALLCQKVENLVAGAPCGVMDQMTSVLGRDDALLALLCQPAELQLSVHIPADIAFWGLDSGERHAVGGADYESVRTGAFMGYRMIAGSQDRWQGYLANVTPAEFEREFVNRLPLEMSGAEFLKLYSSTSDTVTRVIPSRIYRIRRPTAHPIYEHHRVKAFRQLLSGSPNEEQWTSLGDLMYQSHASYSDCGLGSPGTDLIVDLVRAVGPARGLYGARITGGGSGGTVAILGRADAGDAIARVKERYREAVGYEAAIFSGASNGSASFGALRLDI